MYVHLHRKILVIDAYIASNFPHVDDWRLLHFQWLQITLNFPMQVLRHFRFQTYFFFTQEYYFSCYSYKANRPNGSNIDFLFMFCTNDYINFWKNPFCKKPAFCEKSLYWNLQWLKIFLKNPNFREVSLYRALLPRITKSQDRKFFFLINVVLLDCINSEMCWTLYIIYFYIFIYLFIRFRARVLAFFLVKGWTESPPNFIQNQKKKFSPRDWLKIISNLRAMNYCKGRSYLKRQEVHELHSFHADLFRALWCYADKVYLVYLSGLIRLYIYVK